jgi:hypothetical protein
VIPGTIQVSSKKKRPVEMIHWEHGLNSSGDEEVLYMVQYVNGPTDPTLPPEMPSYSNDSDPVYTLTELTFTHLLVETEGRGPKKKDLNCTGEFQLGGTVEVARCLERPPNPDETNGDPNRPLPCCCGLDGDCSSC